MNRAELADFLRRRRDRLRPQEVGLPPGARRRTPGLRREEVAQLAGMSTDYYMRLEQARSPQPSTQLVAALARALRLTQDERDHLYLLTGHEPPADPGASRHIAPGLLYLLDRLTTTPAQVLGDLGDLLAQNTMAEALFGCVCSVREPDRNIVWRWFADPAVRRAYPEDEWEYYSRLHVADLRAAVTRRTARGRDDAVDRLLDRLRGASPEFTALWERHEVAVRRTSRMRVLHPLIGPVELDCQALLTPAADQRLLIFTPPPGTPTIEYFDLLRVLDHEQFPVPGDRSS
ncbi:helix-turn-helix transcriptional regulator [Actinophytocola sp.]|uniref:helix-turn-helix transcriptional regulator n=1 Tax=Actinophytocola sp. TaxID=1872138 RepID=UPI002D7E5FC0|nr:helix-turn-helix transcriptional regulator [Actinophytocola sp.]HET9138496.1 helix-turn-helix transcriptional regulator [Actinophytocola sp.]